MPELSLPAFSCKKEARTSAPVISVLIRVKDEMPALPEFWRRLSSQTIFPRVEVLILDSGSKDGSLDFFLNRPCSVYTIDPKDFSFSSSCNLLVKLARAPVCMLLSAHVFLVGDSVLEELLNHLDPSKPQAVFLRQVPNTLLGSSAYERAYLSRRYPAAGKTEVVPLSSPGSFSNAASALTRLAWESHPFPDVDASEDFLWAQQLIYSGGQLFYLPFIIVQHSHDEPPEAVYRRVRVNAISRGWAGSPLRALRHFVVVFLAVLANGGGLRRAWLYGRAHAGAYL